MQRRDFMGSLAMLTAGIAILPRTVRAEGIGSVPTAPLPPITVYKSPSCGCCGEWVKHVEKAGFKVKVVAMEDLRQVKADAGVPADLESCHTALVGTYVIEGHVPADLIKKMLDEKSKITGLAVGGMIVGSPGMEQGPTKQPYNVMAFTKGAKSTVYARR